jgi:hypothetical protein
MPTAWYRSFVFWFGLPVFVFLVWVWFDSMHRSTVANLMIAGEPLRLDNQGGTMGASWGSPYLRKSGNWALEFRTSPRNLPAPWFPLPSHISPHNLVNAVGHNVKIPHWLLLLGYGGLWQLPWLARYYRRKRIARAQEERESSIREPGSAG